MYMVETPEGRPALFAMVGPAGSGKSTYADRVPDVTVEWQHERTQAAAVELAAEGWQLQVIAPDRADGAQ